MVAISNNALIDENNNVTIALFIHHNQEGISILNIHLVQRATIEKIKIHILIIISPVSLLLRISNHNIQDISLLNLISKFHTPSDISIAIYEPIIILSILLDPII